MSHLTAFDDFLIDDLSVLEQACKNLSAKGINLMFHKGVNRFECFPNFMGDSESGREAMKLLGEENWGKCSHMISLGPPQSGEYQVAIIEHPQKRGCILAYDAWGPSGRRLSKALGEKLEKIKQEYLLCRAEKVAKTLGKSTKRIRIANGIKLKVSG